MTPLTARRLGPQPGPQTAFLSTPADIAVYGGAAGGGKTYALLMEPIRHVSNPKFGFVIFRRTSPEIRNEGGLWDVSKELYLPLRARPRETTNEWLFPSGAKGRFGHLQHNDDVYSWQGSQIPFIGFDELTHFTESQFWYMLSRNRSLSGIRPYIRATCNPSATSWVKRLIAPWVDKDFDGPPAASGELRYFYRIGGQLSWTDENGELWTSESRYEGLGPKSITFISAKLSDNRILMESDPGYIANLRALSYVERRRLLDGDWDVTVEGGTMFRHEWFVLGETVQAPTSLKTVRFWDLAATKPSGKNRDPDWTTGLKMGLDDQRLCHILDVRRVRQTPAVLEQLIVNTAKADGIETQIVIEQEGGSAGSIVADHYTRTLLRGFRVQFQKPQVSKIERAKLLSSDVENGLVIVHPGGWREAFLNELAEFPDGEHDDQVDAASGAHAKLISAPGHFSTPTTFEPEVPRSRELPPSLVRSRRVF